MRHLIELIELQEPKSYSEWKEVRKSIIQRMSQKLNKLNDHQLVDFYQTLFKYLKKNTNIQDRKTQITRLTAFSILSHFNREYDVIRKLFSILMSNLRSKDEMRVRISAKVLSYLSDEYVLDVLIFRRIIEYSKIKIQCKKEQSFGLIILKQAINFDPVDTVNVIIKIFPNLISVALQKNSNLDKKNATRLIGFLLRRDNFEDTKPMLNYLFNQSLLSLDSSIDILKELSETHPSFFDQESIIRIYEFCISKKTIDKNVLFQLCNLLIQNFSKNNIYIDIKKFLNFLVDVDFPQLISEVIDRFSEKELDLEIVLNYIIEKEKTFDYETCSSCPFIPLKSILNRNNNISIHFKGMKVCSHLIECIKLKKDLISEDAINYHINNIYSSNDLKKIKDGLNVGLIYPEKFKTCISPFYIDIFNLDLSNLCIGTYYSAINNYPEAPEDFVLNIVLSDISKHVRLVALKFLKPSLSLSYSTKVFQLLYDESYKVRRKAVKFLGQMIHFNPFHFNYELDLRLSRLIAQLCSTKDPRLLSKTSSLLAACCKHWTIPAERHANNIIFTCLKLFEIEEEFDEQKVNIDIQPKFIIPSCNNSSISELSLSCDSETSSSKKNESGEISFDGTFSFKAFDSFSEDGHNISQSSYHKPSDNVEIKQKSEVQPYVLSNYVQFQSEREINKSKLLKIINFKNDIKKYSGLFKSISYLGRNTESSLTIILKAFYIHLSQKRPNKYYLSIIKSLRRLSSNIYNGLNIRLRCPEIIKPLSRILVETHNQKLANNIIELFATSFDSIDTFQVQEDNDNDFLFMNTTDFVIKNIITYFHVPSLPLFAAITRIIEGDPKNSSKHLISIIPIFIKSINSAIVTRKKLFEYLEIIVASCKEDILNVVPLLTPLILKYFDTSYCLHFATSLSFYLKSMFIQSAMELYSQALMKIKTTLNLEYFKILIKFITYMIIFQNQSFTYYINYIDCFHDFETKYLYVIAKSYTKIVQNIDVKAFQSRLFCFCRKFFYPNLLFSLCLFCDLSPTHLKQFYTINDKYGISDIFSDINRRDAHRNRRSLSYIMNNKQKNNKRNNLKKKNKLESFKAKNNKYLLPRKIYDEISNPNVDVQNLSFMKIKKINFNVRNLSSNQNNTKPIFFGSTTFPSELTTGKWRQNLLYLCVKHSPENSIRSCISILEFSNEFNQIFLPPAFLSCWKIAEPEDRTHFSKIVGRILSEHHSSYPILLELVNMTARALCPMNIDLSKISQASYSHPYSLFLCEKRLLDYPNDINTIKELMNLYNQMEFYSSLKGHFYSYKNIIDEKTLIKWNTLVGNWNEALNYYQREKNDYKNIIMCLAKLNRYNDIYNNKDIFDKLSTEDKDMVSDYFLIAFSLMGDNEKAKKIISSYEGKWSMYRYMLVILFMHKIGRISECNQYIKEGLKFLSNSRQVYISGDQSKIAEHLDYATIFVESKDFLKEHQNENVKITYKKKIKCFHRRAFLWNKLIRFKNYGVPIKTNLQFYLKIISSLRKDKEFKIISSYFEKYIFRSDDPNTLISGLKLLWAKDQHTKAIDAARFLSKMFDGMSFESFKEIENFPLPSYSITSFVKQPSFSEEMKSFCCKNFYVDNFDSFMKIIYKEEEEIQNQILLLLLDNFPEQLFKCSYESQIGLSNNTKYGAKIHRLLSQYIFRTSIDLVDLRESVKMAFISTKLNPSQYKNWKVWAYSNTILSTQIKKNTINSEKLQILDRPILKPNEHVISQDNYFQDQYDSPAIKQQSISLFKSTPMFNLTISNIRKQKKKPNKIKRKIGIRKSLSSINITNRPIIRTKSQPNLLLEPIDGTSIVHCSSDQESTNDEYSSINHSKAMFEYDFNDEETYAGNAISAFLKATQLNPSDSLENLCQLFSLLFALKNSKDLVDSLFNEILKLPVVHLSNIIPQLASNIDHPDLLIRNLIHKLIIDIGRKDFQSIYFPLSLYSSSDNKTKSSIAKCLINKLIPKNQSIFEECELLSDGLKRSAITWFESWLHSIELMSKAQRANNYNLIKKYLEEKFEEYQNPKCALDDLFIKVHGGAVQELIEMYKNNSPQIWGVLRNLYKRLKEETERLSIILLSKVSEKLNDKRDFLIYSPGFEEKVNIDYIETRMDIMNTKQKPRIVNIVLTNGKIRKYLLKGNEDLRLDERFMQFFSLINGFFFKNRKSIELNMSINRYSIVPLSQNVGLIQWITGADTIHQCICDDRNYHGLPIYPEINYIKETISCDFAYLSIPQKIEIFKDIAKENKAQELFEWMWIKSPSIQIWLKRHERFTITNALMSIVGYIIGLGDRHPSNLMIQRKTGSLSHIDFGESFETTNQRKNFPEKVPFRLTRMIAKNLFGGNTHGYFRDICLLTMSIMRENLLSLVSQLVLFIHEPLNNQINEKAIHRIALKLQGLEFEQGKQYNIFEQVEKLINIAEDPNIYIQHYPGWCPFW